MAQATAADPVRATLLAILKQLNQAEVRHEGDHSEQALELTELERRLSDFWAVQQGSIKVALALGHLLRNRLVTTEANSAYSWGRQRDIRQRYQITPEGKKFLMEAIETSDRIQ